MLFIYYVLKCTEGVIIMKWITRSHVHVDRVACPWLIKRFIDSDAEFIFATKASVKEIAKEQDAIPFNVEGVELGHKAGHCSFISILDKYNVSDPVLRELGEIVNAADTDQLDKNPYAPGLEALASGFSLMYPDDFENLERQFCVYDALYDFLKFKIASDNRGKNEG
jgi:hypothetical protein